MCSYKDHGVGAEKRGGFGSVLWSATLSRRSIGDRYLAAAPPMKRNPPVKLVPATPKPKTKPRHKERSALDKPFDAFRVVVGLLAGTGDPGTFESYEASFHGFQHELWKPETRKALADEDLARCKKLSTGLDRDETPAFTDDDAKALIPHLDWLDKACVGVLATTVPELAKAAKKLLLSLSATTYMKRLTGMEAIIAKRLRGVGDAGNEITRPVKRSRPGYVAPTRDNKKVLKTYVDEDVQVAFKAIATLNGKTSEELLRNVIAAVVEQYRQPGQVSAAAAKATERYKATLKKAALRLVSGMK